MSISGAINSDLIGWFSGAPVWQNEAFRRLLGKASLEASEFDEILALARAELGLDAARAMPNRVTEADLPTNPSAGSSAPRFVSLHSLAEVNMLASGQVLEIGPRLTLIFGANGAGKSGYARVLKLACRCHERAVERILPNVYEPVAAGKAPNAIFETNIDGTNSSIQWSSGAKPSAVLRRLVVFDGKAAREYLAERNSMTVVPPILGRLERLGSTIKMVKERLLAEATATQPNLAIIQPYIGTTATGSFVGSIKASTRREDIENALVWSEADQSILDDLNRQLVRLRAEGPQALLRQLGQRRAHLNLVKARLITVEELVGAVQVEAIRKQAALCVRLREEKEAAAKVAFSDSQIDGVGSAAWEDLMRAASAFFSSEVQPELEFPGTPDMSRCVLCQQLLIPEAFDRLDRFWKFLQHDLAQREGAAHVRLSGLMAPLEAWSAELPEDFAAIAANMAEEWPVIWAKIPALFAAVAARRDAVVAAVGDADWEKIPIEPPRLSVECSAEEPPLDARTRALADTSQAEAELSRLTADVLERTARMNATSGRDLILAYHANLILAGRLRGAANSVSTQAISTYSTALQKKYVTKEFLKLVQQNARDLGLRRAVPGIATQTDYGKATQSIQILGAKVAGVTPPQVFSEGEQTALALAYFLADNADVAIAPAVAFDDPVSSLDHRVRAKIVDKLIAVANSRQVIVFTHDLNFYCGLKEAAERAAVNVEVRTIEAIGRHVGLVRNGVPLDAMSVVERENLLEEYLKKARQCETSGDAAGLGDAAARFYGILRSTWERAVEELLFNKVVMRFDEAVKTQSLTGAVVDAGVIAAVFGAMTKCSSRIDGHDHAMGANGPQPDITDMRADLEALRTFRVEQKKKSKAQEKALEHLKV